MIMVIGGAYQGKFAYAKEMCVKNGFQDVHWIDGENCEMDEIFSCDGINHFHKYIERCLAAGGDVSNLAEQIKEKNPDLMIVTDEIGYGIVPIDPFLRQVREQTGRICTELAKDAKKVVRVVCGIPTTIKED